MKIIHLVSGYDSGSAEIAAELIVRLHKAGIDQIAVVPRQSACFAKIEKAGVRLAPHILNWSSRIARRVLLAWLIRRGKADLVQVWMRDAAGLIPRSCRLPVLAWFGGYDDPRYYRSCTDFVSATKGVAAHVMHHGDIARGHVFHVPAFTDFASLPPIDRDALATPKESKILLTLSPLHPAKGLDVFLTALAAMPDCYGWLEGEGPSQRELELLAVKLGVMDRVRFLGKRSDRAALLRTADVCVLASRHEPFGTVIQEAWAAGTPVVACRNDDIAALVEDDLNALLVPVDDAEKLANAMRSAMTDASLRQRLIAQGYAAYIKEYTSEALTRRWLGVYGKVVNSP